VYPAPFRELTNLASLKVHSAEMGVIRMSRVRMSGEVYPALLFIYLNDLDDLTGSVSQGTDEVTIEVVEIDVMPALSI
jgi:hypothetical protein